MNYLLLKNFTCKYTQYSAEISKNMQLNIRLHHALRKKVIQNISIVVSKHLHFKLPNYRIFQSVLINTCRRIQHQLFFRNIFSFDNFPFALSLLAQLPVTYFRLPKDYNISFISQSVLTSTFHTKKNGAVACGRIFSLVFY